MRKLFARGYIMEVLILALTSIFSVPKGTYDIRMVFDATVRGINDYMWAPNFMLPSIGSLLMMVGAETHTVDLDVGYIFYNFWLLSVLAKYCGVDLESYLRHKKDHQGTPLWMIWVRPMSVARNEILIFKQIYYGLSRNTLDYWEIHIYILLSYYILSMDKGVYV